MKLIWAGISAILVGLGGTILLRIGYSARLVGGGYGYAILLTLAAAGVLLVIAGLVARHTRRPAAALLWTSLAAVVVGCTGSQIVPLFLMPYTDDTARVIFLLIVAGALLAAGGMLVLLPVAARGLWRLLRNPERLGWSPRFTQPIAQHWRDQRAHGEPE